MEKKLTVKAVALKDIRGKEQLYITIGDNNEVVISCGEKTFTGVKNLITEPKKEEQSKTK